MTTIYSFSKSINVLVRSLKMSEDDAACCFVLGAFEFTKPSSFSLITEAILASSVALSLLLPLYEEEAAAI